MIRRKSQVLLAVLLVVLGLTLCAFSIVVVTAVIQVLRGIGLTWVPPPMGGAAEIHAAVVLLAAWST